MTGPVGASHGRSTSFLASHASLPKYKDSGKGQSTGGGFSALVRNLKKKSEDESTEYLPDGQGPSRGLPSTGLKRNTAEFKEAEAKKKKEKERKKRAANGDANGDEDGYSSSSSIPDGAVRGDDSETEAEREQGQEGATGRGPGQHEKDLAKRSESSRYFDNDPAESPAEELDEDSAVKQSDPPKDDDSNIRHETPLQGHSDGRGGSKAQANGDSKAHDHDEDGSRRRKSDGFDPEERMLRHDDERMRRLTDEAGKYPDTLKGVKPEVPPGPQNEIVLDPRISHMHYHQQKDEMNHHAKSGPILKITPDGEDELPPGQSPHPSRQNSHESHPDEPHLHKTRFEQLRDGEEDEGHWTTAVQAGSSSHSRPKEHHRFSSFRHSTPEDDLEDQGHGFHDLFPRRKSTKEHQTSGDEDGEQQQVSPAAEQAQRRWSALRSKVLPSAGSGAGPSPGKVSAMAHTAIASVPITTELLAGQLPVMILKTWIDRDDEGNRAVPVLLGNMRFRVGDSVGLRAGKQTGKEMFKVECEYGDGAVKWVIYRELRDFLSLHAHYKAANFGSSVAGLRSARKVTIPDFPRMSIPYLKKLGGDKKPAGKMEYAQASRDALQQYLVELIRAVIFRPESNRLCKFFELSSLTLSLAPRGGFQGKAGYLKLPGSNASRRANQPGLTPTSWIANREPKWFIVRDSYFVVTDGPEATEFYDVFLIDDDFAIERPKRAYRHGLHLMTGHSTTKTLRAKYDKDDPIEHPEDNDIDLDNPFAQEMIINSGRGKGDKGLGIYKRGEDPANMSDDDENGQESHASQHTFYIISSQRRLKLVAKNARQMHQFIVSMERIAAQCVWTGRNRFDSFAPLRVNVAAQWLVDGRDYFWNLSRAINMAKERIYIHDWWISPELYLRRPGDERYRLDNLLKRKAEDGVKIFIIIYNEVSDKTTPVDSTYVKKKLTGLHPNIMIQRSPSHFQTGTFYWSHHEKMCVIDETIAFMGGLDLCYGRWDTSQHILTDEDHTSPDGPDGPVWRGKDYANERVAEFANLDKPFEDTFDRTRIPRMPWHDVGLQIVGQPARDICRHFVQRWNLLIRTKNHKRRLPFLLPAADFTERELQDLKLQGTCEVQICRSVGPWSMGTLTKIEHSIQNAYCKSIEMSEHFVYIENQFFITSTVVDGVTIHNKIGDALVNRIIKAHKEGTPWRACVVIPLLPGYTYPIDAPEASSVRLILECQNRTICRGTHSIFSRLKKEGIDPDEYINFFSLRGWGKFKNGSLTTEQVYIHGKTMIIDDRLVLCGSANINERSQRGDRDSELLAVIRDTDMIDGTMAGKPFKVGRFAHTLRMRLMREHVGVDVDSIEEDQLMSREPVADADEIETWDPDHEQETGETERGVTTIKKRTARDRMMTTIKSGVSGVTKGMSENMQDNIGRVADKIIHPIAVLKHGEFAIKEDKPAEYDEARRDYDKSGNRSEGFASSIVPTLEERTIYERRPSAAHANGQPLFSLIEEKESKGEGSGPAEAEVPSEVKKMNTVADGSDAEGKSGVPKVQGSPGDKELYGEPANAVGNDDAPPNQGTERSDEEEQYRLAVEARKVLRKHMNAKVGMSPWTMPTPTPKINPNRFHDPLDETFWKDMWVAVAVHNTEIFRKVFRCIPDDLVTTWASYKAFANHAEKFNKVPEDIAGKDQDEPPKVVHDGPGTQGAGGGGSGGGVVGQGQNDSAKPSENGHESVKEGSEGSHEKGSSATGRGVPLEPMRSEAPTSPRRASEHGRESSNGSQKQTASGPNDAWHQWEKEEMEALLGEVRGQLVIYSTRFLEQEDVAGQFLFQSDRILPLPIFD